MRAHCTRSQLFGLAPISRKPREGLQMAFPSKPVVPSEQVFGSVKAARRVALGVGDRLLRSRHASVRSVARAAG